MINVDPPTIGTNSKATSLTTKVFAPKHAAVRGCQKLAQVTGAGAIVQLIF